jgi:hypothetical protein
MNSLLKESKTFFSPGSFAEGRWNNTRNAGNDNGEKLPEPSMEPTRPAARNQSKLSESKRFENGAAGSMTTASVYVSSPPAVTQIFCHAFHPPAGSTIIVHMGYLMKSSKPAAFLALTLVSTLLFFRTASAAPATQPAAADENEFIRFVDDGAGGGKLETGIVTYKNKDGVVVHLVGALHVGEKAYYDGLAKTFKSYDALLYEMVKPKGMAPPAPGQKSHSAVSTFQRFLKDTLALDFQLDDIDYTQKNFVHADLDAETFDAMQKQRGESILGIMLHSMLHEMQKEADGQADNRPQMGMIDLLMAMRSPDRPRQLKLLLGRQFGDIEDQMSGLDGPNGSVIITERNKKCLDTLTKEIADGKKDIGIFFGAGHMHDMSARLKEMGFKETGSEWRVGWDMTTAASTQPAQK